MIPPNPKSQQILLQILFLPKKKLINFGVSISPKSQHTHLLSILTAQEALAPKS